jgi:hypothetical protein
MGRGSLEQATTPLNESAEAAAEGTAEHRTTTPPLEAVCLPFEHRNTLGWDLETLIKVSENRDCYDTLELLNEVIRTNLESYGQRPVPFSGPDQTRVAVTEPTQFGDITIIPRIENGRAYIVSDLHSDFTVLKTIFERHKPLERGDGGSSEYQAVIICLGDLIDRNSGHAVQTLDFLINLQRNGFRIIMGAGNHELSATVQQDKEDGGFFDEVTKYHLSYKNRGAPENSLASVALDWHRQHFPDDLTYGEDALRLTIWRMYNEMFHTLPKHVVTENGLLLCHGGITNKGPFSFVDDATVARPSFRQAIEYFANRSLPGDGTPAQTEYLHGTTTEDITWSDFSTDTSRTQPNFKRSRNPNHPIGLEFGAVALKAYLEVFGARMMIRGHQGSPPPGVKVHNANCWSTDQLMTINSFVRVKGSHQTHNRSYLEVPLDRDITGVSDIRRYNV